MSAADALRSALAKEGAVRSGTADALKAAMATAQTTTKPAHWSDVALVLKAMNDALESQQQQADAEAAATPPPTVPQMIQAAISGGSSSGAMPLNGAAVLRAAIAGVGAEGGTINGEQAS